METPHARAYIGHWGLYKPVRAYDNHPYLMGAYAMAVPLGRQPSPSPLARAFSSRVRIVMADKRVTMQALADAAGVSRTYLGKRLRDEASFTLSDVEAICKALGMQLPKF